MVLPEICGPNRGDDYGVAGAAGRSEGRAPGGPLLPKGPVGARFERASNCICACCSLVETPAKLKIWPSVSRGDLDVLVNPLPGVLGQPSLPILARNVDHE